MKPIFLLFPAVAVLVCLAGTDLRADDDAIQQLALARNALADARAWRRTTVVTELDTDKSQTVVAEAVQPALFHLTMPGGEYLSDGKRCYVRSPDGTVRPADPGGVNLVDAARVRNSLKWLLEVVKDAHVEEHKTFRDLPTTVIAFTIDNEGMVSKGKLWVSDADHLPLKIESETHGERELPSGEVRQVNQRNTGSFEYGPSIQLVMP